MAMGLYPFAPEFGAKYILVGPDLSRAVLNDTADTDFCGALTDITGLDSPDVRDAGDILVGTDGGYSANNYYGRRPITMPGQMYGFSSVAQRNVQMSKFMRATNAMTADGALTWQPSFRQDNRVLNPSFEYGITPWTSSAGALVPTVTQSSAWSAIGTKSGRWQATTTSVNPFVFGFLSGNPVSPGKTYNGGATINVASLPTGALPQFYMSWYDVNGNVISQASSNGTSGTGIQTLTLTAVSPAGAVACAIQVGITASGTYGAVDFSFDKVWLSDNQNGYTDGDQANNWWTGTPGASQSGNYIEMFTTYRRQQPTRFTAGFQKNFQALLVSQFAPVFSKQPWVTAGSVGPQIVENCGNYPAWPIITLAGPITNPVITNTTTGGVLKFTAGFAVASGHTVAIDTLAHTAVLDGITSQNRFIDFIGSAWPAILQGLNTYTLGGTGGGTFSMSYRHAWV